LEAGLTTALYSVEIRGASYDYKSDNRFFWIPFGVRGILPLRDGRFELSLGGGGVYEKFSVSSPAASVFLVDRSGWGGQFTAGAKMAIDHGRHFWIGATPRVFFANTEGGYRHDRWFVVSGDVSFRF